jgi:hypothetical protein
LMLLFVEALYRASGATELVTTPRTEYFRFARTVLSDSIGVHFDVARPQSTAVLDQLRCVLTSGPALVPVNIRPLPYFRFYGLRDQAHYLIVRSFESDVVSVTDNLHLGSDGMSVSYGTTHLPAPLLAQMAALYDECYINGPKQAPDGEASYWTLQLHSDTAPLREKRTNGPALDIVRAFLRVAGAPDIERRRRRGFDERGLASVRLARSAGGQRAIDYAIRNYLSECRQVAVRFRILLHAMSQLGATTIQAHAAIESYLADTQVVRNAFLVRCMTDETLSEHDWESVHARLSTMAAGLDSSLVSLLRAESIVSGPRL